MHKNIFFALRFRYCSFVIRISSGDIGPERPSVPQQFLSLWYAFKIETAIVWIKIIMIFSNVKIKSVKLSSIRVLHILQYIYVHIETANPHFSTIWFKKLLLTMVIVIGVRNGNGKVSSFWPETQQYVFLFVLRLSVWIMTYHSSLCVNLTSERKKKTEISMWFGHRVSHSLS